ncbi:MAG: sel1 repeat family protein [Deltaproteobacteria bacterium]|nr:sel1 repeat family protein [Deltaproteobacteria bacterium]
MRTILVTFMGILISVSFSSCKPKEKDDSAAFLKAIKDGTAQTKETATAPAADVDMSKCSAEAYDRCYDDAMAMLKKNDNAKAKEYFEIGCDNGHLGCCAKFDSLSDVTGKSPKTQKLYDEAEASCNGGENNACFDLGFYEINVGNREKARSFNIKACDNGLAGACYNSGIQSIEMGKKDDAKVLYEKACSNGYFKGCFNLGIVNADEGNIPTAKVFYQKGCDGGDFYSCTNLGLLEARDGNKDVAKQLLKRSCDGGDKLGCANLEKIN